MRAHGSGQDQSDTTSYDTRLRYSLQSDLLGYPPGTPMVAPGLSGPRQNYRAPSAADRQPALTMAKKELVKGVWRADEWREFPAFQRALKRYVVGKVKAMVSAGSVNTDVANGGNGE